jgi:hypothetical protein
MITKIEIKTIDIKGCKYDIDLFNLLTQELQNEQISGYFLSPNKIVVHVVNPHAEFGITLETSGIFHNIEGIYNQFLVDFPNVLLETIPVGEFAVEIVHNYEDEPDLSDIDLEAMETIYDSLPKDTDIVIERYTDEEMAEINESIRKATIAQQEVKDDYLVRGKRVSLENISVNNGTVMIFLEDNNIILLQDEYELKYSPESYDSVDGTVLIVRTEVLRNDKSKFELNSAFDDVNANFNTQIESAIKHNENVTQIRGTAQIEDIMKAFDDIENDRPVAKINMVEDVFYKTDQEINTDKMKELLNGLSEVGANFETMEEAVKLDVYGNKITFGSCGDISFIYDTDLVVKVPEVKTKLEQDIDYLRSPGKTFADEILGSRSEIPTGNITPEEEEFFNKMSSFADTVTETIELKVALISFSEFDNYAANHNVVGWSLNSPTTLMIKYNDEGVTSAEKIQKFHDMMDSLPPAWIQKDSENISFYTDFHKVYERDMVSEFMSRVNKHNNFVRESTAKIRAALIDMERDFEVLKNEVNLTIDWDKLTAFATKKERTEHRSRGVNLVLGKEEANVVKITSKYKAEEFYLPIHLFNDDIRQKYTYDDELLRIEDVPDFAFYEVLVNGYVMLIEKTDL